MRGEKNGRVRARSCTFLCASSVLFFVVVGREGVGRPVGPARRTDERSDFPYQLGRTKRWPSELCSGGLIRRRGLYCAVFGESVYCACMRRFFIRKMPLAALINMNVISALHVRYAVPDLGELQLPSDGKVDL